MKKHQFHFWNHLLIFLIRFFQLMLSLWNWYSYIQQFNIQKTPDIHENEWKTIGLEWGLKIYIGNIYWKIFFLKFSTIILFLSEYFNIKYTNYEFLIANLIIFNIYSNDQIMKKAQRIFGKAGIEIILIKNIGFSWKNGYLIHNLMSWNVN